MKNENNTVVLSGRSAKILLCVFIAIGNIPFVALALFFGITAYNQHVETMDLVNRSTTVKVYGTVVDYKEHVSEDYDSSRKHYSYAPIYEYIVDGITYTLTNDVYTNDPRDIGEHVVIYHDTATGEAVSADSWVFD